MLTKRAWTKSVCLVVFEINKQIFHAFQSYNSKAHAYFNKILQLGVFNKYSNRMKLKARLCVYIDIRDLHIPQASASFTADIMAHL